MIEPVHCGSNSILKVRFFGTPCRSSVKITKASSSCFLSGESERANVAGKSALFSLITSENHIIAQGRPGHENNFFTKRQSLLLNTGALGYRATYLMNLLKWSIMLLANYAPTRLLPVFQTIDVKFFQYVHNFAAFTTRNKFLRKILQKKSARGMCSSQ